MSEAHSAVPSEGGWQSPPLDDTGVGAVATSGHTTEKLKGHANGSQGQVSPDGPIAYF